MKNIFLKHKITHTYTHNGINIVQKKFYEKLLKNMVYIITKSSFLNYRMEKINEH